MTTPAKSKSRPLRRWARLRILVINGHVGLGFINGVLRVALRRFPLVDIVFVQEGRHARTWRQQAKGFEFIPQPRQADQPMTYVLVRRKRFEVLSETRKTITHGGQYPRELNAVLVRDRRTGRVYSLSSLHPDPLGKGFERATAGARKPHVEQVESTVDFHAEQPPEVLPFSAGDSNEWLPTTSGKDSVRWQFARIGMTPLFTHVRRHGTVDLMELFARFGSLVKAVSRRSVWLHVKGMDHPVVYAVVKVRKA